MSVSARARSAYDKHGTARSFLLAALFALLLVHFWQIARVARLNHDVAYFLSLGQMLLHGAMPFVDAIDTNPPMIVYLSALPAAVAELTPLPLWLAGHLFFLALVGISAGLFTTTLRAVCGPAPREHTYALWCLWLAIANWAYAFTQFGQREQLIFLFLAPFVVLRMGRYTGVAPSVWLALGCGLLAAVAVAMKPFYVLPVLFVELLYFLTQRRNLRPLFSVEIFVCVAFHSLYWLHFLVVPGMSDFYTYWAGMISRGYSAYDSGLSRVVRGFIAMPLAHVGFLGAVALCAVPLFKRNGRTGHSLLSAAFGWFAIGALAVFFLQRKGWPYHSLPFWYAVVAGYAILALGLLADTRETWRLRTRPVYGTIAVVLVFLGAPHLSVLLLQTLEGDVFRPPANPYTAIIRSLTTSEDKVLFLSTRVEPASLALAYTERLHAGRFPTAWPIAFFFHDSVDYEVPDEWADDEARFYEGLLEDLRNNEPRLVFVRETTGYGTPEYFTTAEYLRRRGFNEQLRGHYRPIGRTSMFRVYARFDEGAESTERMESAIRGLHDRELLWGMETSDGAGARPAAGTAVMTPWREVP